MIKQIINFILAIVCFMLTITATNPLMYVVCVFSFLYFLTNFVTYEPKNQVQIVSVDRPKQRKVMNAQGNVVKRGSLEDCRDFLRCNAQFRGYAIV